MSRIAEAAAVELAETAKNREVKTLVLDIERMKGAANIEFWSLSDFKNRRIHADDVTEWPRTICVAWRFVGAKKVEFASEWDDGQQGMHQRIWDAVNQADIVVGHNSQSFDMRALNTGWRDLGIQPPAPYKNIDTLRTAQSVFGDESRTLDALTRRLGIAHKTDRYDVDRQACAGHKPSQRRIRSYNCGDVVASTELYWAFLPWTKNHPHVAPMLGLDHLVCGRCGSDDVERDGTYSPAVYIYNRYRCNTCGGPFKAEYQLRGPSVKAL